MLCVLMVECMSVVVNFMLSLISVMSPPPCLVQPISAHGGEVMLFESFCFWDELGFLNLDDICMCVVNKQFEFLEFVFNSVYVDLKYNESMCACVVCVVMWSSLVCL